MNGGKPPVRRNVLYYNTVDPSHLLQPIKAMESHVETRCGMSYVKALLGRGRVRLINLRTNRLCCPKCQEFADHIITEADNYYQGDLYEK